MCVDGGTSLHTSHRQLKQWAREITAAELSFDTQKATEVLCVDGGASLHTSHRQLKQWAREIAAAEPSVEARKPLKWSNTPIIFYTEDHPDRTTAVGSLPLLVSPTIRNLKITKMLVDGRAGLNLISSKVINKL